MRPFLDGLAPWLLVMHALCGLGLLAASTHLAIGVLQLLGGAAPSTVRLVRIHATVVPLLFGVAFGLGLLLYPHYRVQVRGYVLDRQAPWASNLFDIKENLAALALPLAGLIWLLGRRGDGRPRALVFSALTLWALVAFAAVAGLLVTSVKA